VDLSQKLEDQQERRPTTALWICRKNRNTNKNVDQQRLCGFVAKIGRPTRTQQVFFTFFWKSEHQQERKDQQRLWYRKAKTKK